MNPVIMIAKLVSDPDFAQADVTHKASIEFEHLLNMAMMSFDVR